jgi:2-keto-4-pentenoate hydratase/2-oxohepta-3-ene-1,7-dioic acid hydratase in catechol pathway
MRVLTYQDENGLRLGIREGPSEALVDLAATAPGLPQEPVGLIAAGPRAWSAAAHAARHAPPAARRAAQEVAWGSPIPHPVRNIVAVGKNYAAHAGEFAGSAGAASGVAAELPEHPIFFTKATGSVIGLGEPIPVSADPTGTSDYEGELAVVIGVGGRNIAAEQAWEHVFGVTALNDVTARDLQRRHGQWFLGKSLDGYCPLGPELVTPDELPPVDELAVTTHVNGELRQSGVLAELVFDVPRLIATLSTAMTLVPGDVIATGTPQGVGVGFDPPCYLRPGDRVAVTVSGVGTLENPVS